MEHALEPPHLRLEGDGVPDSGRGCGFTQVYSSWSMLVIGISSSGGISCIAI